MKNGIEVREEKKFALGAREAGWDRREDGGLGKELGKGRQGGRRENKHGWSKNCASAASKRYLHTPPSPYINTLATGMQLVLLARSQAPPSSSLTAPPHKGTSILCYFLWMAFHLSFLPMSVMQNLTITPSFHAPHLGRLIHHSRVPPHDQPSWHPQHKNSNSFCLQSLTTESNKCRRTGQGIINLYGDQHSSTTNERQLSVTRCSREFPVLPATGCLA